ncbi:MAG: hypothetical protein NT023_21620 [Armatimonadetes bacterium]|nr:hypothetical protein [Armatimonadota bacterium]
MPKPLYPAQGGVHRAHWMSPKASSTSETPSTKLSSAPPQRERELEAENVRLKAELEQLRREQPSPIFISNTHTPTPFVWIALGVCGLCLLFTFAMLLRRF